MKQAFQDHLEETKGHVERLEEIFEELGEKPTGKTCKGMKGLIEEGEEVIDEDGEEAVLDAALIGAAQRVEHYEMAGYGVARTFATILGEDNAADLLQETLDEEGEADKKLTQIAEEDINFEAAQEGKRRRDAEASRRNKESGESPITCGTTGSPRDEFVRWRTGSLCHEMNCATEVRATSVAFSFSKVDRAVPCSMLEMAAKPHLCLASPAGRPSTFLISV